MSEPRSNSDGSEADESRPSAPDQGSGRRTRVILALVIALLVLGYVPFASYLFRDVRVNYSFDVRQIKEYDSDGKETAGPYEVQTLAISGGEAVVINGFLMSGDRLEIPFGSRGHESVEASRLRVRGKFGGKVDQLWVAIEDPNHHRDLEVPIYLSRIEDEEWSTLDWKGFSVRQQGEVFEDFAGFHQHVVQDQSLVGLAGCSVDDVMVALAEGSDEGSRELLPMPLMGDHTVELLVTDNVLSLECEKVDLNEHEGPDTVFLELKKQGGPVVRREMIGDDGNETKNGGSSGEPAGVSCRLEGIPNGLYLLDIYSQDDLEDYVITGLSTSAAEAGFVEHVNLFGEAVGGFDARSSAQVYCNGFPGVLAAMLMWGPGGETTVSVDGEQVIDLSRTWLSRTRVKGGGVRELRVENIGRLNLSTRRGCFSFDRSSILDPIELLLRPLFASSQWETGYVIVGQYGGLSYDEEEQLYTVDTLLEGLAIDRECYFLLGKTGEGPLTFDELRIEFIK